MKQFTFFSLLLLASAAVGQPVVKTANGPIDGTTSKTGDVRIFRGIPFAAPPVGALRWKAPNP